MILNVDVPIFGGAPKPLDEDVVEGTPATVHTHEGVTAANLRNKEYESHPAAGPGCVWVYAPPG